MFFHSCSVFSSRPRDIVDRPDPDNTSPFLRSNLKLINRYLISTYVKLT